MDPLKFIKVNIVLLDLYLSISSQIQLIIA